MEDTRIDPKIVRENFVEMSSALAHTADPELVEDFLYSVFTEFEADEIAKRWALVKDLAAGHPQRVIAKRLGLSLCKITRGSRELKKPNSAFKRMLEIASAIPKEELEARLAAKEAALVEAIGTQEAPA